MKKAAIVLLFIAILPITGCYSSSGNNEIEACTYAEIEVKAKLKSPSTAKFQACRYQNIKKVENNKYTVKSTVESQNGFGAMIQSNYNCTVRFTDGDEYYVNCSVY